MSILHRAGTSPPVEVLPESHAPQAIADHQERDQLAEPPATRSVPRTRVGTAWVGVCAAAVIAIALVIFMLQNTGRTNIYFLWMHGNTSLAVTLLIAAVGAVLLTLILGTARITQLRHLSRRGMAGKAHRNR